MTQPASVTPAAKDKTQTTWTLREYCACQTLQTMLSNDRYIQKASEGGSVHFEQTIAKMAVAYTDALMALL